MNGVVLIVGILLIMAIAKLMWDRNYIGLCLGAIALLLVLFTGRK